MGIFNEEYSPSIEYLKISPKFFWKNNEKFTKNLSCYQTKDIVLNKPCCNEAYNILYSNHSV